MTTQSTCPESGRLQQLLDDTSPAPERAQLQDHLGACNICRQALERLAGAPPSWHDMARDVREATAPAPKPSPALRQLLDELKADSQPTTIAMDGAEGVEKGADANPEADFNFLKPSDRPGYLGQLGHYQVMELIGRGGMGIVFKAFDSVLQRVVAIKVLAPQLAANGTARRRFLREARAAAAVCHEHIVTIHAVEEQAGVPYIVMQYVAGISLEEKIKKQGPLEVKEVLRIGLQAAQGLAMAHAHGLVHRDVKPANILLENGIEKVRLTDFGLARAMDDGAVSQSGVVAGTPQYMAPEQARGEPVNPRGDLFSLGGVLYAMCTGQPPFKGSNSLSILKRVCEENPRPIQEINPEIPAWLVEVIGKLMAKAQDDRYQSANEVAELLQQHLAELQQPTGVNLAVPPPTSRPFARGENGEARRRARWWPWAAAVVLVVAALAGAYLFPGLLPSRPASATLELATGGPDIEVLVTQDGKTVGILDSKKHPALELPPGAYEVRLTGGGEKLQLWADRFTLEAGARQTVWAVGLIRTMYPGGKPSGHWLNRVVFAADGRHALGMGGSVFLIDVETGKLVYDNAFGDAKSARSGLAVSGDGRWFLTSHPKDPVIHLVEVLSGKPVRSFDGHTEEVMAVAFLPDAKTAASAGKDGIVRVWNLATGQELHRIETGEPISCLAFAPDGGHFVAGHGTGAWEGNPGWFCLWSVESGRKVRRFDGHAGQILDLTFHPDGKSVFSASLDGTVRKWDVHTGAETLCLDHPAAVRSLALSPDGSRLLTGCFDRIMRLWDVATGELLYSSPKYESVLGVAFSADGKRALSSDSAQTIRLWALPPLTPDKANTAASKPPLKLKFEEVQRFGGHDRHVDAVALSPDGKLALTTESSLIRVWEVASGKELRRFERHTAIVQEMVFTPDSKRVLSVSRDGTCRVWEVETGTELRCFEGHQAEVWGAALLPGGKLALTGGRDKCLRLWDIESGEETPRFKGSTAYIGCLALSPTGRQALTCGGDNLVRLWDLSTGEEKLALKHPPFGARRVAFSPDGKQGLAGCVDTATAILWDLEKGKEIRRFQAGHPNATIYGVAFMPDGRHAVTGSGYSEPARPGTVCLWEVATGTKLAGIEEAGPCYTLAVSHDGKFLLTTGGATGVAKLYRLPKAVWPATAK